MLLPRLTIKTTKKKINNSNGIVTKNPALAPTGVHAKSYLNTSAILIIYIVNKNYMWLVITYTKLLGNINNECKYRKS